jgi:hypothetical protein
MAASKNQNGETIYRYVVAIIPIYGRKIFKVARKQVCK